MEQRGTPPPEALLLVFPAIVWARPLAMAPQGAQQTVFLELVRQEFVCRLLLLANILLSLGAGVCWAYSPRAGAAASFAGLVLLCWTIYHLRAVRRSIRGALVGLPWDGSPAAMSRLVLREREAAARLTSSVRSQVLGETVVRLLSFNSAYLLAVVLAFYCEAVSAGWSHRHASLVSALGILLGGCLLMIIALISTVHAAVLRSRLKLRGN